MTVDIGETAGVPKPVTQEQRPLPEAKGKLIEAALSQFRGVREGAKRVQTREQLFIDQTHSMEVQIRTDADNASPSEPGFHPVDNATTILVSEIGSGLRNLSRETQSLGDSQQPYEAQLQQLLLEAASETDPIRAYTIADRAGKVFEQATTELKTNRAVAGQSRDGLANGVQQNAEQASGLFARFAQAVSQDLESSLVSRYRTNSQQLQRSTEAAVAELSAQDRAFLAANEQHHAMFKKIVTELIAKQEPKEDSDPIAQTREQVDKETGKSIEDIFASGTEQERRMVNKLLFTQAEQTNDKAARDQLHQIHFDLLKQHLQDPTILYTGPARERTPGYSVIVDPLPNEFAVTKSISGRRHELVVDMDNLEPYFAKFWKSYHGYATQPGKELIEGNPVPTDLTAAIKAAQTVAFDLLGYVTPETARNNVQRYRQQGNPSLSSFKKERRITAAACTEFSALTHEFLSFAGIDSKMILGGLLNVYAKGETTAETEDSGHNFLIVTAQDGGQDRTFLYDPVNYDIHTDTVKNQSYPYPSVNEVPQAQLQQFLRGSAIMVDKPTSDREYFLRAA